MRDATSALVFHTFSYTSQLLNLHFTVARKCTLEIQIAGSTTSSIGSWSTITVGHELAIDLVLERVPPWGLQSLKTSSPSGVRTIPKLR